MGWDVFWVDLRWDGCYYSGVVGGGSGIFRKSHKMGDGYSSDGFHFDGLQDRMGIILSGFTITGHRMGLVMMGSDGMGWF